MRAAVRGARTLLELSAIAVAVWLIGRPAHAFSGYPKGYDASGHLSKARFIFDNWPHVSWNYQWYSGQPSFAGSYPPGYHVLLAFVSWSCGVPLATAMNAVAYGSVLLVVIGLYATVRAATGSRVGALVSAGLFVGTPTLWAQTVVLGLYPRFLALGLMSVALAAAVAHARRGGRWRGGLACLLLALCLSVHPIVALIGVGLVTGVYLLNPRVSITRRMISAAGILATAFALAAYFYLPLGLSSRSQSLFTDSEVSLSWRMLVGHLPGHLDGLTPVLLPVGAALSILAAWLCLRPEVPYAEKAALGRDVLLLSNVDRLVGTAELPAGAGPGVRSYVRWSRRQQAAGHSLRLALLFAGGAAGVFGYGLVGLVDAHFPLYVNGLQPTDLLVYPAFLLSAIVGLVGVPVIAELGATLAVPLGRWPGWRLRQPGRLLGGIAVAAALVAAVPAVRDTVHTMPGAEWTNVDVATHASVLPAAAATDDEHRFAGAADVTSEWVNEYSGVSQIRGYDDHGALHLDWQAWLEDSLLHASAPPAERRFLLDWYAVKWVDADAGVGDLKQYDSEPQTYTPLTHYTAPYVRIQTYVYRQATPIISASSAPTVLVVGDAAHYDLFLRALALSGVGSAQLVPVQGPPSLDDVTPTMLRSFDSVALYGAQVGRPVADTARLADFVRAGGGLFADPTESNLAGIEGGDDSPLGVAAATQTVVPSSGWAWTSFEDPTVRPAELSAFGPPSYASSNAWSTMTATRLSPWAHPVLATHGKTVAVAGRLGQGRVVWEGLNLPYHLAVYRSAPEAAWFSRLLLSVVRPPAAAPGTGQARMIDGEHWRITASGAAGVLFKEQGAPGWHATVDGAATPIFPAGPGMMWIPLTGHPGTVTVALAYRLSSVERLGYLVSVLAAIALVLLVASRRLRDVIVGLGLRVAAPFLGDLTTAAVPLPLQRKETEPFSAPAARPR